MDAINVIEKYSLEQSENSSLFENLKKDNHRSTQIKYDHVHTRTHTHTRVRLNVLVEYSSF